MAEQQDLSKVIQHARLRAVRWMAEAATANPPTITVTRRNVLAEHGITELRLETGQRVKVEHDGDGITFMAVDGSDRDDVVLTDNLLYFHKPLEDVDDDDDF